MKKKIIALMMCISMFAIALVGGTLAYFTDTDAQANVFTTGSVDITLNETFDEELAKLIPGVKIEKAINVENTGSENAFVRVHIAFPAMLDSGSEDEPEFAAYNNLLHWNMSKDGVADGAWNFHSTNVNGDSLAGYPGNGGEWNMYQQEIDGVLYNVYVATYETALAAGEETVAPAITNVYLDTAVTQAQMADIMEALGGNVKILVLVEGGQEATFEGDAYNALNTQFGVPGTYDAWAEYVAE